jgi:hypothetical protein
MTTINLYQNQEEVQKEMASRNTKRGLFFSIGILVFTLLVLAGFKIAVYVIERQTAALANTVQQENTNIAGFKNLEQIIDMQTRLQQIKSNLQIKNNAVSRLQMTKILDNLGADVNQGIVIAAFKYDDSGRVALSFDSSNFSDLSKQILSFKSSNNFTNVDLAKISRGEKAIACDVEMSLKK